MNTNKLLIYVRNIFILYVLLLITYRVTSKWDNTSFWIVLLWVCFTVWLFIIVLVNYQMGEYDEYIRTKIDPKIEKIFNWLNRKNK